MALPDSVKEIKLKCDICSKKFKIYRYANGKKDQIYPFKSDTGITRKKINGFDNNSVCNECWEIVWKNVIEEIKRKKDGIFEEN